MAPSCSGTNIGDAKGRFKRNRTFGPNLNGCSQSGHCANIAAMLIRLAPLALLMVAALAWPSLAQQPHRIVAVGDLHGDYEAWLDIARDARLIDSNGRWTGGKTTLVQLGDVTDRGPDSLKIVRSLQQLAKQAPRSGGKVIVVLGNHEAMNLLGDLRYTTPGEFAAFADARSVARREQAYQRNQTAIEGAARAQNPALTPAAIHDAWIARTPLGWAEHRAAWSPNGDLGRWATHNPAIVKIDGTLFVHGGISFEYSRLPVDEINRSIRDAMASADDSPKSILNDPLGPLWYRGLVGPDRDAELARGAKDPDERPVRPPVAKEFATILLAYKAQRLVIAHTPVISGIRFSNDATIGDKLVRVDTGNSRYYSGQLSFLEIIGERVIPHAVRRALSARSWSSQ